MFCRHVVVDTALGDVTIVARDQAVTGLYFAEHARRPAPEASGVRVPVADERPAAVWARPMLP
ncbi:hypothetical protein ABZV34_35425 [Streptomyces sp. NPDC005195]|uniref:hypothetical protein n=1 Tax=Streptomyces sp. NPDC005195 TaxID=3154561 RepID=UPI0033B01FF4